jgi:uncharacterized membrane protein
MNNRRIHAKHRKTTYRGDWHALWPVWALCAVLLLFVGIVVFQEHRATLPQKSDIPVISLGDAQDLHLDRSKVSSPQLHLFEASASGQKVKFIVQRTQDNTIHVALASCRVCYHSRNSPYARKDEMVCGRCRQAMRFESKDQKAGTNTCALAEIPHTETDREVVVLARDVFAQVAKLPQ